VTETGGRIAVRVAPGARRSEVVGRHGEAWKVRVAAPPERGRANAALLELLARTLGVRREHVKLLAGASGKDKVIGIEGMTTAEADEKLRAVGRKGE
jgi:uncharacterized protein (TIGR00251 family)